MGRTVFIDGGGNAYESHKKYSHLFPADVTYVFEPNARFWDSYVIHERPDLILLGQAIWTQDCQLPLFLSPDSREVASSLLEEKMCKVAGGTQHGWQPNPRMVDCVDFADWLRRHTIDSDRVILKLDIEGAEVPVLRHLLDTGMIGRIAELYCEFHLETLPGQRAEHDALVYALTMAGKTPRPWD